MNSGKTLDLNFENRIKSMLGDEYPEFEKAISGDRVFALRINELKKKDDSLPEIGEVSFSDEDILWEKCGHIYTEGAPGKHAYHEAGVYYIQEPSAMAPVCFLDPEPGEKILDLCAAPGGKSTQIAGRMKGQGILVTNEIDKKRAQILSLNIERCAVKNALVTSMRPDQLSEIFEGYFDKILVDAPCSGEGMFRKNEEAITNWSIENVKMCAERQKSILEDAVKMLAPGGRLVYSTCTFAPEEDELQVMNLLKLGMKAVKTELFNGMVRGNVANLKAVLGDDAFNDVDISEAELSQALNICSARLWPHKVKGEGHFLAVFEKEGDISLNAGLYGINGRVKEVKESEIDAFISFAADTLNDFSFEKSKKGTVTFTGDKLAGTPFMFGNQLYLAPVGMPGIAGLSVLRPGLHLGTIKKDRFEPSHAFALFLTGEDVKNRYDLKSDAPETWQFIGGQSLRIPGMENGWYLILTDGYSLGWGKYAGGTMKNHYPKGLRIYV